MAAIGLLRWCFNWWFFCLLSKGGQMNLICFRQHPCLCLMCLNEAVEAVHRDSFVSSVSARFAAKKTWARCGMDQRRIITRVSKARNSKKTLGERLLPMIYYLLPITYYLLPTTYSTLPTTSSYLLPTTYYLLPITYMFSHVPMSSARILKSQSSEVHFYVFCIRAACWF